MAVRVLIVDDEPDIREVLAESLTDVGYQATTCGSGEEALGLLDSTTFDVVVTDVRMPSIDGIDLCTRVAANHGIPVVVMTAFGETSTAVDALRAHASDFVTKPFGLSQMTEAITRAMAGATTPPIRKLDPEQRELDFSALIGRSDRMRELREHLALVAASDATVLITGQSGTGKEIIARSLWANGLRRTGPFVAVSCAAVPAPLLEGELFGHERGAFTGATERRPGLFQDANGGTLFLDEISAMPLELQPAFLRVLQERVVRPVGGTSEQPFDVRVIAAANQDLTEAVRTGTFRAALLYRLSILTVEAPPLRERGDDVLVLARHFLARHAERDEGTLLSLSDAATDLLRSHSWPGNVRELENCIEAAAALARGPSIEPEDLPLAVRDSGRSEGARVEAATSLGNLQREQTEKVLRAVGGNKAEAARLLGIDRVTLYRRIKRFRGERPAR